MQSLDKAFLDIVEKNRSTLLRKGATKHSNRKRGLTITNHANIAMVLRKSRLSSSKWSLMNSLIYMAFSSKGQDARLSISKWCVQVTQVSPLFIVEFFVCMFL